ncbi:TonB-dependent receptor [Novosphingobium sp. RL4]|uniref:TonB-dependent receptor n=1 Tax=Novosphingobium sp. RL4 TaxID=3109595 RepID=UPI002D776575|nr:TonB-dependent receptor [Novosphingobium sp. RL4]WRT94416.1 TonB-dependent receptor [Novosphingobium sp. RL4]
MRFQHKCAWLTATAIYLLPSLASAQANDAPAASAEDTTTTSTFDIVVTASRRSQRLQDTALAVNAVSSDELNAAGLTDTASLQRAVPNLQFSTTAGSSFVYLRGIGSNVYGSFSDNSVATYVDGVYIPNASAAVQELFDVDRVEVLRGPQATLYGRNATGGAILINTARPSNTFTASGDMQIGNMGEQRYRAMVSGPLIGDVLSGRVAVVRHRHDGYSTNLLTGDDFNDQDFWGIRGSLLAQATDNLTLTLIGNYSKESGSPGASKAINPNSLPFAVFHAPFSPDPRASYHNLKDSSPSKSYGVNLRIAWDTEIGQLASVSSYNRYKLGPVFLDLDDSSASLLEYQGQVSDTKFYYQDLTFTSKPDSGPFGWMLGGTALKQDTDGIQPTLTPGGVSLNYTTTKVTGFAVYAQADYAILSQLKLVAGLRYSKETREGTALSSFNGSPAFFQENKQSWDDVSPKFSLEYRPIKDTLIYLSATKGFKSGAFDPINVSSSAKPENIWSYEAGLRTELFDRRLTLNLTAFHYDYKDLQVFNGVVNGSQVQTFLQNAGKATVNGLEFEPTLRLIKNLRIGGNLSLLDGKYADGTILADIANGIPGRPGVPAVVQSYDVGGNPMIQAPKVTATAFIDWTIPLADGGSIQFYGDYFHQSKRYFTAFKDESLSAGGYDLANLRLTYNLAGDRFYIAGFVRNVGNTLVRSQVSRTPPFGTLETYAPPRLYGGEVGFRF